MLVEVKLFTSVLFADVYLGTPQNFTPVSEHVYLCLWFINKQTTKHTLTR